MRERQRVTRLGRRFLRAVVTVLLAAACVVGWEASSWATSGVWNPANTTTLTEYWCVFTSSCSYVPGQLSLDSATGLGTSSAHFIFRGDRGAGNPTTGQPNMSVKFQIVCDDNSIS